MIVFLTNVEIANLTFHAMFSTSHYLPTKDPFALLHVSHVSFVSSYIYPLTSDILTRHETRRQIYGIKWSTLNKGRYCIVWAKSLVDVMRIGGYWATLKSYILAAIAPIYFRFALEYGQKLNVFTHIKNVQIYEEKTQRETSNRKKWQFVISACLWYYQP